MVDIRNILVTGAAGLLGSRLVSALANAGFQVIAFDLPGRINRRISRSWPDSVSREEGDIRDRSVVNRIISNCDAVIHSAFVLPPLSEADPGMSFSVNVEGSLNLVEAALARKVSPVFLFISSYTVYGHRESGPPLSVLDDVAPFNNYTNHKVAVEQMLRKSGLHWSVMRFGVIFDGSGLLRRANSGPVFDIPADGRQELIDIYDAVLAVVALMGDKTAWDHTYLIGGGNSCQLRYLDMINGLFDAIGLQPLPAQAFSPVALQGGCWMDTRESQARFEYQRTSFEDLKKQIVSNMGFRRNLLWIIGPIIRMLILRTSPYFSRSAARIRAGGDRAGGEREIFSTADSD